MNSTEVEMNEKKIAPNATSVVGPVFDFGLIYAGRYLKSSLYIYDA